MPAPKTQRHEVRREDGGLLGVLRMDLKDSSPTRDFVVHFIPKLSPRKLYGGQVWSNPMFPAPYRVVFRQREMAFQNGRRGFYLQLVQGKESWLKQLKGFRGM
jgi:hypothetical protein